MRNPTRRTAHRGLIFCQPRSFSRVIPDSLHSRGISECGVAKKLQFTFQVRLLVLNCGINISPQVFKDKNTQDPYTEDVKYGGIPNHIYMDAMGFGMGCCCLQMTFQTCNIQEARTLYDQLTPLCPVMVRLPAINFHIIVNSFFSFSWR